jgi:transposase
LIQGYGIREVTLSRGDLTEAEWRVLKDLLPIERETGNRSKGRPAENNRNIINGILWRLRTGTAWRDVPEKYGNWNSIYRRFRRWSTSGVWEAVAITLAETMADSGHYNIDSTSVRAHVSAAGGKGGFIDELLAARGAGSPVKFIVSLMPGAVRSPSTSLRGKRQIAKPIKS